MVDLSVLSTFLSPVRRWYSESAMPWNPRCQLQVSLPYGLFHAFAIFLPSLRNFFSSDPRSARVATQRPWDWSPSWFLTRYLYARSLRRFVFLQFMGNESAKRPSFSSWILTSIFFSPRLTMR